MFHCYTNISFSKCQFQVYSLFQASLQLALLFSPIYLIKLSIYHLALFKSSIPFLYFQRHKYLIAFAVSNASIPSKP